MDLIHGAFVAGPARITTEGTLELSQGHRWLYSACRTLLRVISQCSLVLQRKNGMCLQRHCSIVLGTLLTDGGTLAELGDPSNAHCLWHRDGLRQLADTVP